MEDGKKTNLVICYACDEEVEKEAGTKRCVSCPDNIVCSNCTGALNENKQCGDCSGERVLDCFVCGHMTTRSLLANCTNYIKGCPSMICKQCQKKNPKCMSCVKKESESQSADKGAKPAIRPRVGI